MEYFERISFDEPAYVLGGFLKNVYVQSVRRREACISATINRTRNMTLYMYGKTSLHINSDETSSPGMFPNTNPIKKYMCNFQYRTPSACMRTAHKSCAELNRTHVRADVHAILVL